MLQSCLTKHLLKADILFRGEFEIMPVDSGICRCRASDPLFRGCHQSGSFSGVTRERHPASQSEHLCRTKRSLSDKGSRNDHRTNVDISIELTGIVVSERLKGSIRILDTLHQAVWVKWRGVCSGSGLRL